MNTKTFTSAIFLLLFTTAPVWAADEADDFLQVSDAFLECAALQNTMAELIADKDAAHSQALTEAASDAETIAGDMLLAGGFGKERLQTLYDAHFIRFQSLLDSSINRSYQAFTTEARPVIVKCAALHDVQTSLIAERRKQNYQPEE